MSGQQESNPLLRFHGVAQFQHKYARQRILQRNWPNEQFARIAQNNAVRVSEIVRKTSEQLSSATSGH